MTNGGDPFSKDPPPTDREALREVWHGLKDVRAQLEEAELRLAALEKFHWGVAGGIAVVIIVIVPIFIRTVVQ